MKTFVTLFEKAENIHLIKDVGQIPYLMHKYFDYDSNLVTYKNDKNYDYLDNEVQGLKLSFIPKVKIGRYSLSMLWYLFFNAKKIDILHMFHHREKTYLNFMMYKWRNPRGVAYLKSDMGLNSIKKQNGFIPTRRPKYAIRALLLRKVLPMLDIISVESSEGERIVSSKYSEHKGKFIYIPNGINLEKMYSSQAMKRFEEKENIILTVGRIGAPEKNNELLLDVLESIDLQDYKVVFIGPIEESFKTIIENFYDRNPNLKEKVIFTGAIYNRTKLYEWYAKSKIFCLTSKEESFGFVLIEAMAYGNFIVTTPISSALEITEYEKVGSVVSAKKNLEKELAKLINNDGFLKKVSVDAMKRAKDHYAWSSSLAVLDEFIENNSAF